MATTITGLAYTYDTQECGRCGGCGRYSYCPGYGSICFGCGGSGTALTPAARRARKTIAKHRTTEVPDLPAADVRVGMVARLPRGLHQHDSFQTVTEVTKSQPAIYDGRDCNAGVYEIQGVSGGLSTSGSLRVMPTAAQFKAFAAKIARLRTGVTITATLADGSTQQVNKRPAS